MVFKKGKENEFSPALAVAASLSYGGEGICSGGMWLFLWAEISTGLLMACGDVIEKIKQLAVKME